MISDEKRAEIIEAFTGGEPEALPDGVFYYEEPLTFFANFFADYTPEKVRELARQIAETEEPLKVVEALRELANQAEA